MVFEGIVAEERYRFLTDGLASAILFAIIHGRHVGSAETQSRKVWEIETQFPRAIRRPFGASSSASASLRFKHQSGAGSVNFRLRVSSVQAGCSAKLSSSDDPQSTETSSPQPVTASCRTVFLAGAF